ncbi:2-methylaconitate cis-trans isomerase PrpF family protein [Streptococcus thoraltensis]|uniref:2-methylaconitate cis-trans isomerase PrpF family protein n=1 Tax=Streptococcus thoraltensis TaxID=55085 RepID=UPI001F5841F9|nr:PrpF domain-containing protein [Streptococcus thoraltensis]
MLKDIPISIYRGGTSKGVFIDEKELPEDLENRNNILLKIMGSPDSRQIDGLGGAVSTTSKVAIISKEQTKEWDVNYTFAQVAIDKALVSYAGNCGNISSAVGVYAIENNLVEVTAPVTCVRVYNTNTKKIIEEFIPTPEGQLTYEGDFEIAGVPGKGLKIKLAFKEPEGAFTGKLFPTNHLIDKISLENGDEVAVSIVDVANPLVYIKAKELGLRGSETPKAIDGDPTLLGLLEEIRGKAAVLMGIIEDFKDSAKKTPGVPKLTIVSAPETFLTSEGHEIKKEAFDIAVRMMSMQKAHKSIALTGSLCTSAACRIPGTIPYALVNHENLDKELRIAHSSGIIPVSIDYDLNDKSINIDSVSGFRTARKLMVGTAFIEEGDRC